MSRMKRTMPYIPDPTPPKMTSPICMLTRVTSPPKGVRLSCMALTAPHEASVVTVANMADPKMPKRTSLPSMFVTGACATSVRRGVPRVSAL